MQPPPPAPPTLPPSPYLLPEERRARATDALGLALGALWSRRKLVAGVTAVAAIGAVVISLLLPVWYLSSARVLMPDAAGGLNGIIGNLSPQAARLLGSGGSSDYSRYLAILTSESMRDRVIEEFDLMRVYNTADKPWPRTATHTRLTKNSSFEVDLRYNHLTIAVLDRDPERAARMANFYVDELNRRNAELSVLNAGNYRRYVEGRHREVVASLDSAQAALQRVQEELGVVELPTSAEAFFRGLADQRGGALRAEMEYQSLLQQYGPENSRVQAAREVLRVARAAERSALQGADPLLPIGMAGLPGAANRYATAYRDVVLHSELMKVTQPLYEQARFDEERERTAVQVLDTAVPPERKAAPRRSLIVILATGSAFALAVLLALALGWLDRYRGGLRQRESAAS